MNPKKVLIVDDEPAILGTLQQIFERSGYQALTAESAEKALDILEKETVMIMFLDLNLPGMSGVDLCRLIRRKNGLHYPCPHGLCEHLRTDRVPRGWFR